MTLTDDIVAALRIAEAMLRCQCDAAYTSRGIHAPECREYEAEPMRELLARYEAERGKLDEERRLLLKMLKAVRLFWTTEHTLPALANAIDACAGIVIPEEEKP